MKSIIALLQFTTILPLGKPVDFEYFARHSYLYPLAGYVTGGLAAAAVCLIPYPPIAAAVAIALVLLLSGCNHFDGLLDFGDGLMAHGSRERRIQALTDRQTGAGALALGLVVTLLSYAGLQAAGTQVWVVIIFAEVCAKLAMSYMTTLGKPFREGIHSYFHGYARPWFIICATVFVAPLLLLPLSVPACAAGFGVMILTTALMLALSYRLFDGVNGDLVGATHEITRACVILALAFF